MQKCVLCENELESATSHVKRLNISCERAPFHAVTFIFAPENWTGLWNAFELLDRKAL